MTQITDTINQWCSYDNRSIAMSDWPIVSTTLTVSNEHGEADWLLAEAGRRGLWTGAIVEELVREKIFGHPDLRIPDNHCPDLDDGD